MNNPNFILTMGIEELLLDRAMKQGIDKGYKMGLELVSAIENGNRRKILNIARKFKKAEFTSLQIADFTKLSVEEIEKL